MSTALAQSAPSLPAHAEALCLQPSHMVPGHRVTPLFGGAQAYPAMLEAIAAARSEILLETYIWANDENGRRFIDAVCIKAHEGVEVRCVIDGAGSFGFSGDDLARMRDAGVKLSIFHPVGPWRRRWGWQVRDHRKLLLVDGRLGFAGGMNLGNDYAPLDWGGRGWNDVHARIEGPVLRGLRILFELTWRHSEPETWEPAGKLRGRLQPGEDPPAVHGSTTRVQALAVGRFFGRHIIQHHLRFALSQARDHIFIQAAYFLPNRTLRAALKRAARRGVDVRIMVPRNLDVPMLTDASRFTWAGLMKDGVKIYEWLPGMMHAKTLTIDGAYSTLGSYNLDQRSLLYNWEVSLAVLDAGLAASLEEKFREDLSQCAQVDAAQWKKRGAWRRLREDIAWWFRVWL